ncbi:hypothetical protein PROFUN_11246 [Planoprotostelium fungivorum]|uniref:Clu domain-containing protein n=1 Tax=Planoprotostelium fungivorum TaxID=1890364 RepID=A0A2P6NA42_9EUKA|nr:hypothetical protein PROFUN_11246 [Planoprotostelium fungivorum]
MSIPTSTTVFVRCPAQGFRSHSKEELTDYFPPFYWHYIKIAQKKRPMLGSPLREQPNEHPSRSSVHWYLTSTESSNVQNESTAAGLEGDPRKNDFKWATRSVLSYEQQTELIQYLLDRLSIHEKIDHPFLTPSIASSKSKYLDPRCYLLSNDNRSTQLSNNTIESDPLEERTDVGLYTDDPIYHPSKSTPLGDEPDSDSSYHLSEYTSSSNDPAYDLEDPELSMTEEEGTPSRVRREKKKERHTVKDKLSLHEKNEMTTTEEKRENVYRDWNEEYQTWYGQFVKMNASDDTQMSTLQKRGQTLSKLNAVSQQFVNTATIYAKIIISEYELPLHRKTIKPIDVGGVAGGVKYRVQNIMYKFAFDILLVEYPPLWMYGGPKPDHRAASKAAKNEMRGLEAHSSTYIEGLFYPMMALVDYLGFRVVAMPVLPIDKTTLRYGSDDGGETVHDEDEELREKMRTVAERLYIRGHMTGHTPGDSKMIYGPGDIEGHRGHDGRMYIVADPATRLHPRPRSVFYELLRPEFLAKHKVSLCSDAFTRWNTGENKNEMNDEVRAATKKLLTMSMQELHQYANFLPHIWSRMISSKFDREAIDTTNFVNAFTHILGINFRYNGLLEDLSEDQMLKKIVRSGCIARCAKSELREILRLKMRQVQAPSEEDFKSVVVRFMNELIGGTANSKTYWSRDLCRQLVDWFWFDLSKEQIDTFDITTYADIRLVINFFTKYSGIELEYQTMDRFVQLGDLKNFRFVPADIRSLSAVVKQRSDIYFSMGMLSLLRNERKREKAIEQGKDLVLLKDSLLRQAVLAVQNLRKASVTNMASPLYLLSWATAQIEMAKLSDWDVIDDFAFVRISIYFNITIDMMTEKYKKRRDELVVEAAEVYAQFCEKKGRRDKRDLLLEFVKRTREQGIKEKEDFIPFYAN